mmetsp:Transcript_16618/g.45616  ORF Transcript_16618/g.45616 Transcript_16618/m.45616 type:complete len:243 (+) Transcript_16618:127-855(+)
MATTQGLGAKKSHVAVRDAITARSSDKDNEPPAFVYQHTDPSTGEVVRDLQGHRVLHSLPARMDPQHYEVEHYARQLKHLLATVIELQPNSENSKHRILVLLDLRPGQGWPNPPALTLVSWIRHLVKELQGQFPETLHKLVLYPLPQPVIFLYNTIIRPLLRNLSGKVVLVPGSGVGMDSPFPLHALSQFVAPKALQVMEDFRLANFGNLYDKPSYEDDNNHKDEETSSTKSASTSTLSSRD